MITPAVGTRQGFADPFRPISSIDTVRIVLPVKNEQTMHLYEMHHVMAHVPGKKGHPHEVLLLGMRTESSQLQVLPHPLLQSLLHGALSLRETDSPPLAAVLKEIVHGSGFSTKRQARAIGRKRQRPSWGRPPRSGLVLRIENRNVSLLSHLRHRTTSLWLPYHFYSRFSLMIEVSDYSDFPQLRITNPAGKTCSSSATKSVITITW